MLLLWFFPETNNSSKRDSAPRNIRLHLFLRLPLLAYQHLYYSVKVLQKNISSVWACRQFIARCEQGSNGWDDAARPEQSANDKRLDWRARVERLVRPRLPLAESLASVS